MGGNSSHAANVHTLKNAGYDPIKDFTSITQLSINPLLLVVNSELPVHTVQEFIEYAKEHPGRMNYATGNSGMLVAAQLLKTQTGIDALAVNYSGGCSGHNRPACRTHQLHHERPCRFCAFHQERATSRSRCHVEAETLHAPRRRASGRAEVARLRLCLLVCNVCAGRTASGHRSQAPSNLCQSDGRYGHTEIREIRKDHPACFDTRGSSMRMSETRSNSGVDGPGNPV